MVTKILVPWLTIKDLDQALRDAEASVKYWRVGTQWYYCIDWRDPHARSGC